MFFFLLKRSMVLGAAAGLIWLSPMIIAGKVFMTTDIFFVFFLSILFSFIFFSLICMPVVKFAQKKIVGRIAFAVLGMLLGIVAVYLYVLIQNGFDPDYAHHVFRLRREHLIFGLLGAIFFVDMRSRLNAQIPRDV